MEPSNPLLFDQSDRYLSLPLSRLVINPYAFEAQDACVTQAAYAERATLPLNIGYCSPFVTDRLGIDWFDAVVLYERSGGEDDQQGLFWNASLSDASSWNEEIGPPACRFYEGRIVLGVSLDPAAPAVHVLESQPIDCDLDRAVLSLSVGEMSAASSLAFKIVWNDGKDKACLLRTRDAGVYSFPLGTACGLHGRQRISVQIHILDGRGDVCELYNMSVIEVATAMRPAATVSCRWNPAFLEWNAAYPAGGCLSCTDYFADEQTVARHINWQGAHPLVIAGRCFGQVSWSEGCLQMGAGNHCAQVFLPAGYEPHFYPSLAHFLEGTGASPSPMENCAFWAFNLPAGTKESVPVYVRMGTPGFPAAPPQRLCTAADQQRQWEKYLSRIPLPTSFSLSHISTHGVTPERLQQMYYAAWAQIIADILPPSPEASYPYASMATGKASLWAYGAPACAYAASWETFYGIMLYAQIEPEQAWDMFTGLMTLVDSDGRLGGESLPSVKAQTAWILYRASPDIARLTAVMPALERYLLWRLHNLRWIYLNKTPYKDERDLDFVAAALIDIEYFRRLCRELGQETEERAWKSRQCELYAHMASWFFQGADSPCQYYYRESGLRNAGNPLTVTKALHIPHLKETEASALKTAFFAAYQPDEPFGGFQGVKAENMAYTFYGLWEQHLEEEAVILAETAARDVTLSGFLAEEYNTAHGIIQPSGVRPSIFGCALLIESLLFLDGKRLDGGACPQQNAN